MFEYAYITMFEYAYITIFEYAYMLIPSNFHTISILADTVGMILVGKKRAKKNSKKLGTTIVMPRNKLYFLAQTLP